MEVLVFSLVILFISFCGNMIFFSMKLLKYEIKGEKMESKYFYLIIYFIRFKIYKIIYIICNYKNYIILRGVILSIFFSVRIRRFWL